MNEPIIFTTGRWHGKSAHVRREALAAADRGERVFHATFEPWEDFSRSLAAAIGAPIDDQYSVEPSAGGYVITRRETKEAAMEQSKRVIPLVGDVWRVNYSGNEYTIGGIDHQGAVRWDHPDAAGWLSPSILHKGCTFIRRRNAPDSRIAELEAEIAEHVTAIATGKYPGVTQGYERFCDVLWRPESPAAGTVAMQGALAEARAELAALRGTARNAETIPAPASVPTIEERYPVGARYRVKSDPGKAGAVTGHESGCVGILWDDRTGPVVWHAPHSIDELYERTDTGTHARVPGRNPPTLEGWARALGVNIAPTCDFTGPTIPPHALELTDHGTCRTCASSASDRRRARRARFDAGVSVHRWCASGSNAEQREEANAICMRDVDSIGSFRFAKFGDKRGPLMPTDEAAIAALWQIVDRGAR